MLSKKMLPVPRRDGHLWFRVELDELYRMDYLFFSEDHFLVEKDPKYYQKTCKNFESPLQIHSEKNMKLEKWYKKIELDEYYRFQASLVNFACAITE